MEICGSGKITGGLNLHLNKKVTLSTFESQSEIGLGNRVLIGDSTFIGSHGRVTIGDNMIAAEVEIVDTDWHGNRRATAKTGSYHHWPARLDRLERHNTGRCNNR